MNKYNLIGKFDSNIKESIDYSLNSLKNIYSDVYVDENIYKKILNNFYKYILRIDKSYKLDSFKLAACLLVSIKNSSITLLNKDNKDLKEEFAILTTLKMLERPFSYIKYDSFETVNLEKFYFKEFEIMYYDELKQINDEFLKFIYNFYRKDDIIHLSLLLKSLYNYVNLKVNVQDDTLLFNKFDYLIENEFEMKNEYKKNLNNKKMIKKFYIK